MPGPEVAVPKKLRSWKCENGNAAAPKAPKLEDLKDTVAAVRIRRGERLRGDGPDDRGLTRGGVPPEEFFSRKEEP